MKLTRKGTQCAFLSHGGITLFLLILRFQIPDIAHRHVHISIRQSRSIFTINSIGIGFPFLCLQSYHTILGPNMQDMMKSPCRREPTRGWGMAYSAMVGCISAVQPCGGRSRSRQRPARAQRQRCRRSWYRCRRWRATEHQLRSQQ